jgi:non-specific serine/threonine protein kinase
VESSEQLRVYLFGHLKIEKEQEQVDLPTRKEKLLAAYLLLNPGFHSREKLAALFWGDVPDDSARASLRNALSSLRRKLGSQLLSTDREMVQINPGNTVWVDALAFQTQAERFLENPSPDPTAVTLDLVMGDLLTGFYDDWVLAAREEFRMLHLETLLVYTQQMRSQSEYARAIDFAEQVLAVDQANERAHQHLMFCYLMLGNRDAALKQYETCRNALRDELAVEPSPETKQLYAWIQQAPAEKKPVEASITNLPIPQTTFVGRQQEMAELKKLLSSVRLLTLTGAGGSGKTRLAIQVATDLLDGYADGVWWVTLAEIDDAKLLPRTVAKSLGVPEFPNQEITETLVTYLNAKQLLLVLDNCEHLIEPSARLADDLLSSCPHIQVLATSRETLNLTGEHVWPVPVLSFPNLEDASIAGDLLQFESVHLFIKRANAVNPDFTMTDDNAYPVAQICMRLEGLPLALELAATRVKVLTVKQIASRLDDAFNLLTDGSRTAPSRHQTLRATIDWSFDLLSESERILFRRLSVFASGWTLPAAEAVCAGEGIERKEIIDLLTRLVEKSLVEVQTRAEESRFRMLKTLQQYSRYRLQESNEYGLLRDRHLDYFLQFVESAHPHMGFFLSDEEMAVWMNRFEADYNNLRAAVRWSIEKGDEDQTRIETGLRLAGLLHWFWSAQGSFSEGRTWLTQLLNKGIDLPKRTQAQALLAAGYLACWQGEFSSGRNPLQQAKALFQQMEDGRGIAFSQHGLGFVAMGEGDAPLSRALFEDSLEIARAADDDWLISFALHFLAIVLSYMGDYEAAISYFKEGIQFTRVFEGHTQGLAFSLFHLARIARIQGDYPSAWSHHVESIKLFKEIGDRRGIGYSLAGGAILAAAQGELHRAARLAGAVTSMQNILGPFLEVPLQIEYDQQLAAVEAALGNDMFEETFVGGQAMTIEQAIDYALEKEENG